MKRKVIIGIIVIIAVLIVIGIAIGIGTVISFTNKEKKSITAAEFKDIMEQKGFEITDAKKINFQDMTM